MSGRINDFSLTLRSLWPDFEIFVLRWTCCNMWCWWLIVELELVFASMVDRSLSHILLHLRPFLIKLLFSLFPPLLGLIKLRLHLGRSFRSLFGLFSRIIHRFVNFIFWFGLLDFIAFPWWYRLILILVVFVSNSLFNIQNVILGTFTDPHDRCVRFLISNCRCDILSYSLLCLNLSPLTFFKVPLLFFFILFNTIFLCQFLLLSFLPFDIFNFFGSLPPFSIISGLLLFGSLFLF